MKITTQGNGIRIGTRLEEKIASKMSKFDKYFGDEGTLNVRLIVLIASSLSSKKKSGEPQAIGRNYYREDR